MWTVHIRTLIAAAPSTFEREGGMQPKQLSADSIVCVADVAPGCTWRTGGTKGGGDSELFAQRGVRTRTARTGPRTNRPAVGL